MSAPIEQLPAHRLLPESDLSFHPDRPDDRHVHPPLGLVNYGSLSRSSGPPGSRPSSRGDHRSERPDAGRARHPE